MSEELGIQFVSHRNQNQAHATYVYKCCRDDDTCAELLDNKEYRAFCIEAKESGQDHGPEYT
jgi:hypothetical protein